MNKLITCASLAALGVVGVQAQSTGDYTAASKPWSVSAKLRGFYDDNYNTAPSNPSPGYPEATSSWGFSVSPGIAYNLVTDLTTLRLGYDYDLRWFADRDDDQFDQTHRVELGVVHAFSERLKFEFTDSLVYADEPSVIEPDGQQSSFLRTESNAWRNYGGAALNAMWTEQLGSRLGYQNGYYDYEEAGPGSRSALLDRMEHLITADLRWHFQPTLVGLVGYQFGIIDYRSSDFLWNPAFVPGVTPIQGTDRDQQSHYGFLGADYTINPRSLLQVRAGADAASFPDSMADDVVVPYFDIAFRYEYMEGSKFVVGAKHDLRPTDIAFPDANGQVTMASEATTAYLMIAHRIADKLVGSVRGSWQGSEFIDGFYDGINDNYYTVDVNLAYEINAYLTAEVGYAYDFLDSEIPNREYDRNRVYFGVRAVY